MSQGTSRKSGSLPRYDESHLTASTRIMRRRHILLTGFLVLFSRTVVAATPLSSSSACFAHVRASPRTRRDSVYQVISSPPGSSRKDLIIASARGQNGSSEGGVEQLSGGASSERAIGILVLLTVPLSWGTYVPVVRYLYEIQPPIPGFVFSAAYYLVASLTLLGLMTWNTSSSAGAQALDEGESSATEDSGMNSIIPALGGMELGTYLFLGNGLQVLGLKTVPSDRAGFLVQLTTVMVPLVSAAFAGDLRAIPLPTWAACGLAFAGVVVMGTDGKEMVHDGSFGSILDAVLRSFTGGDCLIIAAAFVYTLHVVRLGRYATETAPLTLAAYKATTEAVLSTALVVGLLSMSGDADAAGLVGFARETGHEISSFFAAMVDGIPSGAVPVSALLPAIGATLWTGWVTCAYTIFAQSFGQRRVSPTDANLIYTVQPLFTALFAWVLLGETLGPTGFVGGALIGSAVYLVAGVEQRHDDDSGPETLGSNDGRAKDVPSSPVEAEKNRIFSIR